MPEETQDFISPLLSEFNAKLRDIEEKQKILKERVLLIGQNLVGLKDRFDQEVTNLKIDVDEIKESLEKIRNSLMRFSDELEKRARRTEVETLENQFRMFEPLKGK